MSVKLELAKRLQWDPEDNSKIYCDREGAAKVIADHLELSVDDVLKYSAPIEWLLAVWNDSYEALSYRINKKEVFRTHMSRLPLAESVKLLPKVWAYILDNEVEDKRCWYACET